MAFGHVKSDRCSYSPFRAASSFLFRGGPGGDPAGAFEKGGLGPQLARDVAVRARHSASSAVRSPSFVVIGVNRRIADRRDFEAQPAITSTAGWRRWRNRQPRRRPNSPNAPRRGERQLLKALFAATDYLRRMWSTACRRYSFHRIQAEVVPRPEAVRSSGDFCTSEGIAPLAGSPRSRDETHSQDVARTAPAGVRFLDEKRKALMACMSGSWSMTMANAPV